MIAAASVMFGCENFLDTESYTERNTGNFPGSETDAIQLVTGIYAALNGAIYEPMASYWMAAMFSSDECFGGGGADDYDCQATDHFLYSDPNCHTDYWNEYYAGITRANMAIANLDKVENEVLRNQLMGEAYFLRSYFLFELAQCFGEIPLTSKVPEKVSDASEYPEQASIEKVYGTIAAGLKKAIEIMPSYKWNQCISGLRHATKWDAEGILARVYLFYTGFYSDKTGKAITALPLVDLESGEIINETLGKEFVISSLEDCIEKSGHSLVPDFRLQWPYMNSETKKDYNYAKGIEGTWYTDDVNPEEMFSVCCTNLAESSRFCNKFDQYLGVRKRSNYEKNAFPLSRGYGWAPVNPEMWNTWDSEEPGDIRKEASIYNIWTECGEDVYTWGNDSQLEETGFWQKKYQTWGCLVNGEFFLEFSSMPSYGGTGVDLQRGHAPQNLQLLRFADVLLMHSELTKTADGMNRVRARVNLGPKAYSEEAIRMERKHELCFEGLRWMDIRRYGKAYAIEALKTQLNQDIKNLAVDNKMKDQGAGYEARYNATYGFRPFPQSEVKLSNGALKQNAGWEGQDAQYAGWK